MSFKTLNAGKNIDTILNEEIKKFLNEGFVMENDNFRFRQEIKDSTFFNYEVFSSDFDADINDSDIFISWHISFWLNDFGVENFIISIDGVEGTYKLASYNKHTDALENETDKNIAEQPWKFNVGDAVLNTGGGLYVSGLDFDFKTNICSVTF